MTARKTKSKPIPRQSLEQAAECLRTLAHPVRLQIIENLLQKRYTVGELAELCDIRPNVASEHLRLMEHCGLLGKERDGRKVFYQPAHGCLDRIMNCVRGQFAG